jgi:hypothetical protein
MESRKRQRIDVIKVAESDGIEQTLKNSTIQVADWVSEDQRRQIESFFTKEKIEQVRESIRKAEASKIAVQSTNWWKPLEFRAGRTGTSRFI